MHPDLSGEATRGLDAFPAETTAALGIRDETGTGEAAGSIDAG